MAQVAGVRRKCEWEDGVAQESSGGTVGGVRYSLLRVSMSMSMSMSTSRVAVVFQNASTNSNRKLLLRTWFPDRKSGRVGRECYSVRRAGYSVLVLVGGDGVYSVAEADYGGPKK